jgi:primosomal protein N' (replication factor Y)
VNLPIAKVALDLPLDRYFDFLAPGTSEEDVGRLVIVPFGRQRLAGVIVDVAATSDVPADKLKALIHVQRDLPKFSANDYALFRFCAGYYHAPFGQVALNALPPAMRVAKALSLRREKIVGITGTGLAALADPQALPARATAQRAMLELLKDGPQAETALRTRHERAAATLRALLDKQWVARSHAQVPPPTSAPLDAMPAGPELNEDQQRAVGAVTAAAGTFSPFLLSGITGSGKTEVYLRLIADTLARGRQVLVLLPEINLTPQFLRQVAARFPSAQIAPQHSGLADVPRLRAYLSAQSGAADIVIGTRLAVFTPIPRLGLIVVDEEHDASLKQQEGVRYSARDVAVFRAQQAGCPIVLGSATPSLESIANAQRGRFAALLLPHRAVADAVLPKIDYLDLDRERAQDGLTDALIDALRRTIARGEQALVFINRRGFAPALVCTQCGEIPHCTRCSARLVFHQKARRMKCHHCGYETRVPQSCGGCGSAELVPAGQGTERIEAALRAALPDARIARVDRDTTRRRGSAERIFDAAAAGEIDLLVGTQMLAKGHDFPRLTLVGVINADGAMFSADFRAGERLAAQLMQVAGRAGRAALPGRVLIQTRLANHPLYAAVAAQDHAQFAAMAMAERKMAHLPPYTYLALLRAEAKSAADVDRFMAHAATVSREVPQEEGLQVWDPVPATLERKAGFERRQLMLQADSRAALQRFLTAWLPRVATHESRAIKWIIDVDPLEL